ncbi:cell surface A33 antigen [Ambystoma mexicanum]|uniref:cell surface A33 antigen n=1 Tax=Ambystoma mexicanum TaxID=8296 RepID=UPI0037E96195
MGVKARSAVLVLLAVLDAALAIKVTANPKVIQVARGKNATLPCKYETTAASKSGGIATWKRFLDQAELISRFFNQETTVGETYTDRVAFTGDPDGDDLSVFISQVKMGDNGTYQCEVIIPRDRQGTPLDKVDLLVLVAPSKPKQSIAGTVEYGQVITLTCFSEEGSPIPTYTWQSYSVENQLRPLPPTAVVDKGDLTLKNISADTSGFYFATVSNTVGKEFCNITVAVMPPSMNIGFYAGIIGGSVAGILLIGIIAYCCCCRDREDKEDYEMAEREEAEQTEQRKPGRQRDDYDDDDDEEHDQRSAGPPMPPANKPRMIPNEVDA